LGSGEEGLEIGEDAGLAKDIERVRSAGGVLVKHARRDV
jgi:hypothetical protein